MRIEMLKPHSMLAVGDIVDFPPPIATLLIQRGVAVAVHVEHPPPSPVGDASPGVVAVNAVAVPPGAVAVFSRPSHESHPSHLSPAVPPKRRRRPTSETAQPES